MGHLLFFGSYNKAGNATNYMEKKSFLKILHKYQQGKATKEEQDYLEGYYNLFGSEENAFDSIPENERQEYKEGIRESIFSKITSDSTPVYKVKFIERKFVRLAAATILLMIISASAFYLINGSQAFNKVETIAEINKENRVIFLPDGSKVILSAGSKLNYPSSFDGLDKREVTLLGEGYFDVRHDASKPFVVHSGKLETVVLGTAFNIKAITGQDNITVTVRRGKVKVINPEENEILGIITPNQQIVYNMKKVKSVQNSVADENYLTWMNADLLCDNLTLAEAVELLKDQYKVKIEIKDKSILSQRFTTTFSKKEKVENIIESICLFNDLKYKYDSTKSTYIIMNKNVLSHPQKENE